VILPLPFGRPHCAPMTTNVGQGHTAAEAASKHKGWSLSDQRPFRQRAGLIRLQLFKSSAIQGAAGHVASALRSFFGHAGLKGLGQGTVRIIV